MARPTEMKAHKRTVVDFRVISAASPTTDPHPPPRGYPASPVGPGEGGVAGDAGTEQETDHPHAV